MSRSQGVLPFNYYDYGLDEGCVPPYESDGWVRADIEEIAQYQVCRFDSAVVRGVSAAVAFGRLSSLRESCQYWPTGLDGQ